MLDCNEDRPHETRGDLTTSEDRIRPLEFLLYICLLEETD